MTTAAANGQIHSQGLFGILSQSASQKTNDWIKLYKNYIQFSGLITNSHREAKSLASTGRRVGVVTKVLDAAGFPKAVYGFGQKLYKLKGSTKIDAALHLADGTAQVTDSWVKVLKAGDAVQAIRLRNADQWTISGNIAGAWMCARGAIRSVSESFTIIGRMKARKNEDIPVVDLAKRNLGANLFGAVKNISRFALNAISIIGLTFSLIVPAKPMLFLSTVGLVTSLVEGMIKDELKFNQENNKQHTLPQAHEAV